MLLLPKAIAAAKQGDDALLRFIVGICEEAGLSAVSVAQAAPGLVCGEGALGKITPDDAQRADIARGFAIVRALGALDVGQAAVVCDGLALAVEAAEGTDAMLARIADLREALRGTAAAPRGVLVKALKPTQDATTDMPVVGIETVRGARQRICRHRAGSGRGAGAGQGAGGGRGRPAGAVRRRRHASVTPCISCWCAANRRAMSWARS